MLFFSTVSGTPKHILQNNLQLNNLAYKTRNITITTSKAAVDPRHLKVEVAD